MPVLERWNQVAAAQFNRVQVQLGGDLVHQPLDQKDGFRSTRPPIGVGGSGVGKDTDRLAADILDVVGAAVHQPVQNGGDARSSGGEIGSHGGEHAAANPRDGPVLTGCHLDVFDVVATVYRRQVVLASGFVPADRAVQSAGRPADQGLIRIDRDLAAETAPDLGCNDPELVVGYADNETQDVAADMRILGGAPKGHLLGAAVPLSHGRSRLHGRWEQPLLDDPLLDHHIGLGKGGFQTIVAAADDPAEGNVGRHVVEKLSGAVGGGVLRVDHRLEGVVIDFDQLQRILGLVAIFSHHDGHRVALVTDPLDCQGGMVGGLEVGPGNQPGTGHGAQIDVGSRKNGHHTRRLPGRARVDPVDAGVPQRTPKNRHMDHVREGNVGRIFCLAREQPGVFATTNARTEYSCTHLNLRLAGPRAERPPRSSGSRCSGTSCLPSHAAPRLRWDRDSVGAVQLPS